MNLLLDNYSSDSYDLYIKCYKELYSIVTKMCSQVNANQVVIQIQTLKWSNLVKSKIL